MKPSEDKGKFSETKVDAISLGTTMAVSMALFTFIGYRVDLKLQTEYWTLTGMFCGLFYCGYEVWKVVRSSGENSK